MKKIIDFIKGLPIYAYLLAILLVVLMFLASCQGLFNVNTKDSDVDVVLNDSLNLGGNSETQKKSL